MKIVIDIPEEDYIKICEEPCTKLGIAVQNGTPLPKGPRWIPVSERLPEEENKRYWICTDAGYQCECRWTNVNHIWTNLTTDWHWHIMDVPQYSEVIAWMPLPEPYKVESEDK